LIVKLSSDISDTCDSPLSVIRILHKEEETEGTTHSNKPSLGVFSAIVVQLAPLFVLSSILTSETLVDVHVIFCEVPEVQLSPPFGDRTVSADCRTIEKVASLTSEG
jgi:hypothetical protein